MFKPGVTSRPADAVVDILETDDLQKRLSGLSGTAFIIIIGQEDGKFGLYYRQNNPCQGGHLRKYGSTHDDCTRPVDRKPGDLPHPFPLGNPVGLVYRYNVTAVTREKFEASFSDDSPWVSGFGGSKNVEFLKSKSIHYVYEGFYLKSGNFDPTVLVNLMKQMCIVPGLFAKCRSKGLSTTEALAFCAFFYENGSSILPTYNPYYFDPMNSARRMVEKRSVNITGGVFDSKNVLLKTGSGLWGDKYDYNRPDMACVFRLSKSFDEADRLEKEVNIARMFNERKSTELDVAIEVFKEALNA